MVRVFSGGLSVAPGVSAESRGYCGSFPTPSNQAGEFQRSLQRLWPVPYGTGETQDSYLTHAWKTLKVRGWLPAWAPSEEREVPGDQGQLSPMLFLMVWHAPPPHLVVILSLLVTESWNKILKALKGCNCWFVWDVGRQTWHGNSRREESPNRQNSISHGGPALSIHGKHPYKWSFYKR